MSNRQDQEESLLSNEGSPAAAADNGDYESVPPVLRKIAATTGGLGVALGAFGAHALKETLTKRGSLAMWQTATTYQLFHATAILSLASSSSAALLALENSKNTNSDGPEKRQRQETTVARLDLAGKLMGSGILLFSGSIYCLALGVGPTKVLGPITPIGGLLMIYGWIVVGMA
mmetsp:Transcript_1870/g.4011  ORF Transcript_1870/g.4011 Transcript_1870/m.4011 type:complete len:174 (+) Transcript_1870:94-615(+)